MIGMITISIILLTKLTMKNASETQREQENCSAEVGEHVWATSTTGAWFPDGEYVTMGTCMGYLKNRCFGITMVNM